MDSKQILPVNGRIFIETLNETQEYEGSLHLLETAKEKSNIGLIVRLPIGYNGDTFSEGDKVLFNRHSGSVIVLDRLNRDAPEYRLILESDILAKIDGSNS